MATLGSTCLRREAGGWRVRPYVDRERASSLGRYPEGSTPLLRGAPRLRSSPRAWPHVCLPVRLSRRTQDRSRADYSKPPAREPACELSKTRTCAPAPPAGSPFEAPHLGMWSFLLGFATSDLTGFISPLRLDLPSFFFFIHLSIYSINILWFLQGARLCARALRMPSTCTIYLPPGCCCFLSLGIAAPLGIAPPFLEAACCTAGGRPPARSKP